MLKYHACIIAYDRILIPVSEVRLLPASNKPYTPQCPLGGSWNIGNNAVRTSTIGSGRYRVNNDIRTSHQRTR